MLILKTKPTPNVVYMDVVSMPKLRSSIKDEGGAGADLRPVGGVVAGAALVQGAAVQEGEHAAPRRRAAANHSSVPPSSQPITAHLAVSSVDTKHCSVTASSRASRGDASSRKSRFTLFN